MLDHLITVVLRHVFRHWKATGLKVSKVMGIQNQDEVTKWQGLLPVNWQQRFYVKIAATS